MADELKKKFQEMQEQKHGKKEIQIDEFEWIEVIHGLFPCSISNYLCLAQ